jgi:hypothetical protein
VSPDQRRTGALLVRVTNRDSRVTCGSPGRRTTGLVA